MTAREFKRRHEMDIKEMHSFLEPFIMDFTEDIMRIPDDIEDEESDDMSHKLFLEYNAKYIDFARKWNHKFRYNVGKKQKKCVTPMDERWFYNYAINNDMTGKEQPYTVEA